MADTVHDDDKGPEATEIMGLMDGRESIGGLSSQAGELPSWSGRQCKSFENRHLG